MNQASSPSRRSLGSSDGRPAHARGCPPVSYAVTASSTSLVRASAAPCAATNNVLAAPSSFLAAATSASGSATLRAMAWRPRDMTSNAPRTSRSIRWRADASSGPMTMRSAIRPTATTASTQTSPVSASRTRRRSGGSTDALSSSPDSSSPNRSAWFRHLCFRVSVACLA